MPKITENSKAEIGEGEFFFQDQILPSITEEVIFKPEDTHIREVWKQFLDIIPKSQPDEHKVLMSPRVERVKKDLGMAQPGLYFVDFTRYAQFVHIREVFLQAAAISLWAIVLGLSGLLLKLKRKRLLPNLLSIVLKSCLCS